MERRDEQPETLPTGGGVVLAPGVVVPASCLRWSAARSSGPGGQNVNKVSSKVELRVHLSDLPLPPGAAARLRRLAGRRVNSEGELLLTEEGTRSQSRNRSEALERLREFIGKALILPKPRIATKPTKGSVRRRLREKEARSKTKVQRRRPADE